MQDKFEICIFDENDYRYYSCEKPTCKHTNCQEHEEYDWEIETKGDTR